MHSFSTTEIYISAYFFAQSRITFKVTDALSSKYNMTWTQAENEAMKRYNEIHYWRIMGKGSSLSPCTSVLKTLQTCFVHVVLLFAFSLGYRNVIYGDVSLEAVSTDTFKYHLTKTHRSPLKQTFVNFHFICVHQTRTDGLIHMTLVVWSGTSQWMKFPFDSWFKSIWPQESWVWSDKMRNALQLNGRI